MESYSSEEQKELEKGLRPEKFKDFQGQENVLNNLKVFVSATLLRNEAMDHVLLHGPPGLGKTTLSTIISKELKTSIHITSGVVLEKPSDLAGMLTKLETKDVLFIDEIHRLHPSIEEYLYSAMEDFYIDIIIDSGPNARTIQLNLNPFTLIGATTRSGLLTAPLRSRFGINLRLDYYQADILEKIILRSADLLKCKIEERAALEIAKRSRGTPRIANHLLRRTRDFAQVEGNGNITIEITKKALTALNIDLNGLEEIDNKILSVIIEKFNGGPVGISTIATACNEEKETIEEIYEPFLIKEGFIKRTPRGRMATDMTYRHFKKIPPDRYKKNTDRSLFMDS